MKQLINHHQCYRMACHQNECQQIQNYHKSCIDHCESFLLYKNQELFQRLVHCVIECEERAKFLQRSLVSEDFDRCEKNFGFVSEFNT